MRANGRGNAFRNPMYHLTAYGLGNPYVAWAIERGVYRPDMCIPCQGTGLVLTRYGQTPAVTMVPLPPKFQEPTAPGSWTTLIREGFNQACCHCKGTGHAPDRPVHEADFLDEEELAAARRAFPGMVVQEHSSSFCPFLRARMRGFKPPPGAKCVCILV